VEWEARQGQCWSRRLSRNREFSLEHGIPSGYLLGVINLFFYAARWAGYMG